MRICTACVVLCSVSGTAMGAYVPGAALVDPGMSGVSQYDGWIGLTSTNYAGYGGFPGTGAWPAPIGSNRTVANTFDRDVPGDAGLVKMSNGTGGGPYLASGSIYYGGFSGELNTDGGTLAVVDSTPVAGVENVVFQIQIGEAWTYDFFDRVMPTLSFNGLDQRIEATTAMTVERFFNGTVDMPTGPEDVFINTYLLQWDLRGYAGSITDLSITFTGVQHAQLYGMRLDQSDVYVAVPTPGSLMMAACGGVLALRRRR